jgi:hypothetical protein
VVGSGLPQGGYLYNALLFGQSYRDFHADLFPDTTGCEAQLSAAQWLQGQNASVPRVSLDPAKRSAGENAFQVVANDIKYICVITTCGYISSKDLVTRKS